MFKIFDFKCTKCENIVELLLDKKDIEHVRCPDCGGHMKKLIAAPPFHLKGAGWAKDNYGLKKEK